MERYRYSDSERAFMENCDVPFAVYQFINKRVYAIVLSGGFVKLFELDGMAKEDVYDLMDKDMYHDTHPDDLAMLGDAAYRFATKGGVYDVLYRSRIGGAYQIVHAYGRHITKENGVRLAFVWYSTHGVYREDDRNDGDFFNNAIKNQLTQRSIGIRETHDYLTGLPSMTYFFELAEAGCREIRDNGELPAILFMDFNGMKGFNQKYGLQEGDRFLKDFAKILVAHFSHENCSRFSADHFCVFSELTTAGEEIEQIIEEIGSPDFEDTLPLRVGIYSYEDEKISISGACDRAKIACDTGRKCYESKVYLFNDEMMTAIENRQYIVENFERALKEGWIEVFYQPVVRTANGKVCAEEALARWKDPEKGILAPDSFIPALEEANRIYKLDLYVVDAMLKKMKEQADNSLYLVPQSVNLSRLDFYACDILDEIRRRVDDAGIQRDRLVIEITESVIASDINYMTKEIRRFKELGFQVWMDDYGSGYSSPVILQDIPFDLIKIDRLFVNRIGESEKSRIILAEIIKMAMALGMDTIAEGVETEEQVNFLKGIGCTMLQGFYYCKPIRMSEILERNRRKTNIGFENPMESGYYSKLGRVNLYDLSILRAEDATLNNYFDTWPMVMLEYKDDWIKVIRYNKELQDFTRTNFPGTYGKMEFYVPDYLGKPGVYSLNALIQCAKDGKTAIIDDRTADGKTVQMLVWKVARNPVTHVSAVMAVVLSMEDGTEEQAGLTYNYIARTLAQDFVYLYFVDMDTDHYTEYQADGLNRDMTLERHGLHFFADSYATAKVIIHKDDQEEFFRSFNREAIEKNLRDTGSFTIIYRNLVDGKAVYVSMKITRIRSKGNYILIGINNIDAQMKTKVALEQIREERLIFQRMTALSGDFVALYNIDPVTDEYFRFSLLDVPDPVGNQAIGKDFYEKIRKIMDQIAHDDDKADFFARFRKETVLGEIREKGKFITKHFRIFFKGEITYVQMKATMVNEKDKDKIIMGIINVDDEVRRQKAYIQTLSAMENEAFTDELTGVKRKHAYIDLEAELNKEILKGTCPEFAIAVFDINGLKEINDTYGHLVGDQYIIDGSKLICRTFQHSPVYRIGGDEFAVIARGEDYRNIEKLMEEFTNTIEENRRNGDVVVAAGISKFSNEKNVAEVFQTADQYMYRNKEQLKKNN
uniref:sensor domain-containing diguanylate cyclase n=1 Tax=Eubacterium cellulosolvens TaxID=29322 RepID=UPI0009DECA4D|nr:EAL domain-containing protein [[Eubacterium] cellulosolvens]